VRSRSEQYERAAAAGLDPGGPFTNEELWEAYELVCKHGTVGAAARKEGWSDGALRRRYNAFVAKAERGDFGTEPVIPTFRISKATSVLDAEGNVQREYIQQTASRGDQFVVPADQRIKGISALVDSEGREIVKWIKTKE